MNRILSFSLILTLASAASAQEKLPPGAKVTKLEFTPTSIELKHPFDYRQLLITATLDNGDRVDATRMAAFKTPAQVKVSEQGLVRPAADGAGVLNFTVAGQPGAIPVKVSGQKEKYEVSFIRDIMPAMSRMGCNAGTCHGSAQGKNGFQLSLRGYDPVMDHRSLTDDLAGRRFNRAAPEKSLMLMKPAGAVPHVGGVLTQPGQPYYEMIRTWIAQGVKLDLAAPKITSIEIQPSPSPVVPLPGMSQQMLVFAKYANGEVRDVTAEAFLESSNTEVAKVDKTGLVNALRRGETAILARYEGNYAAMPLIVMGDRSGFAWAPTEEFNWIDKLVYDKLKEVKVLPADVCTDSEFIRRLHLDLTGLPPTPEAVRAFLADTRPARVKREEMVDKLVGSPDFIEHWTNKWADLLEVNRKFLGVEGADKFRAWIKQSLEKNVPYDKFCNELLTATGSNMEHPAASYFKIQRDPVDAMENTTHLFLAVRFNCNKCHDHPFERWTMNQYYTTAAYFAQITRKEDPKFKGRKTEGTAVRGPLPLVEIIEDAKGGDIKNERTGGTAVPTFPFRHASMPDEKAPRRTQLAAWITSKDNPYFAKSYANRVWSYLLGTGIIEPIDDIRAGNPATNPQLLDRLTKEFVDSGFDVQKLIKTICKSRTYQHSHVTSKWNEDDDINYSHAIARRLPAEVLYDSIHRATGATSRLPGLPPGARAAQLLDSSVPVPGSFLELFGKPPRESACECERTNSLLLGPVLNLVNGPVLADALRDPANRIAKLLATEKDDAKVVREIYLSILCRYPSDAELKIGLEALRDTDGIFADLKAEKDKRKKALDDHESKLPALQTAWEKNSTRTPTWHVLAPDDLKSAAGTVLVKQPDGSILATGKNPSPETYTIKTHTDLQGITGIRLEVLSDPSLPAKGPGRAGNGNFVLNEFKVAFAKKDSKDKEKPVKLTRPQATFSQDTFNIAQAIDNNPATGWAISPQFGRNHTAVFEVGGKVGFKEGTTLTFTLMQQFPGKDHNIGKFRLSVTTAKPPILLEGQIPPALAKLLDKDAVQRTPAELKSIADYYRSIDPELQRLTRLYNEYVIPANPREVGAQDLAWALINSPAFLFNH
ncbi:MAG: DUF1553 domain-containing protein [Gemmataceae bacterium]